MKTFKTLLLPLVLMVCGSAFSGCVVRAYALADEPVVYVDPFPIVYGYGPTVYVDSVPVYVAPRYGHVHGGLRQASPRGYYSAPPARRYGPPPGAYPPRRR